MTEILQETPVPPTIEPDPPIDAPPLEPDEPPSAPGPADPRVPDDDHEEHVI